MQVNIHEAKTQLSKLAELVSKGQKVVIAKAGKPCMDLVPHREGGERKPGRLKGSITLAEDFDQTPDEVIRSFEDD